VKAVLLNGALDGDGSVLSVHAILAEELARAGWQLRPFILREWAIRPCTGCFGCWVQTPGVCVMDDAAKEIVQAVIQSRLTIFLTPVTFGGYSSELKKGLDRLIPLVSPFFERINGEVHHRMRYPRYPNLLGVGVSPHPDDESTRLFTTLLERNAINFHAPSRGAGVVAADWPTDRVRNEIRSLLAKVGVAGK